MAHGFSVDRQKSSGGNLPKGLSPSYSSHESCHSEHSKGRVHRSIQGSPHKCASDNNVLRIGNPYSDDRRSSDLAFERNSGCTQEAQLGT